MKSYNQMMDEAVSAARLAQLRAKGKGKAAKRKMEADGLISAPKPQGQKEKQRRLTQGRAGQNKGGALAKQSKGKLAVGAKRIALDAAKAAVKAYGQRDKPRKKLGGPLAKRTDKGSALVRGKNYKEPNQKDSIGYRDISGPTPKQQADAQRKRILTDKGMKNRGNAAGSALRAGAGAAQSAAKGAGGLVKGAKKGLRNTNRFLRRTMDVRGTDTEKTEPQDLRGSGPKKFGRSAS